MCGSVIYACRGKGIASNADAVSIFLPLTTDGLLSLIEAIIVAMKHNSPAALMVLGSACIAMHYQTIVELNGECPAPLVCGDVGTGKSLALRCALVLIWLQQISLLYKENDGKVLAASRQIYLSPWY